MNFLTVESIAKSYSEKPLFSNISLSLNEGQKTAIIAANGSGKSTILKIIAGAEQPDSGKVTMRNDINIGYLDQHPFINELLTIKENLFLGNSEAFRLIGDYETLISMQDNTPETNRWLAQNNYANYNDALHSLIEKLDLAQAWDIEARATEILGKLNIHDLNMPASLLSGGERKRIALAQLLIKQPDLLLMDEPTNHLDLDMIEWLENYLNRLNKTLLLITHDRYFLDNVCNQILELENGQLYGYNGNYAYYLEKKELRLQVEASEYEKNKNRYSRELEWMRRQPKARTTKSKSRIDAFSEIESKVKGVKPEEKHSITMQMNRMGSKILEFENICKSYGDKPLIKDFSYTFKRGEKIGIVGKNGCGKSTLLRMIMQEVKPDAGRIKHGETIVFGYYNQQGLLIKEDKRVIEVMKDIAEYVDTGNGSYLNMSQFLNYFKFDYGKQHTYVSKLSGGERRRLYLLTLLIRNPNFLILDEPTNDLDIVTLNLLEEFLTGYQGCLLLVTHDRYFMDRLVDHVFVFTGNGNIKDIHGNYTEYRNLSQTDESHKHAGEPKQVKKETARPKAEKPQMTTKKKLTFREQHELVALEKELAELEQKKADLLSTMSQSEANHETIRNASEEFERISNLIDEKSMRWLELSEIS